MKPLILLVHLACGGDAISSHVAITQYGAHEVLMPVRSPWALDAAIMGQAVTSSYSLHSLSQDHPKLARGLAWTIIGLHTAATVNNIHQMREVRR